MTISINQISSGMALRINNEIYLVQEFQHVKPGKGSAFVRVKLRQVKTDAVLEKTFRTSDRLEDVPLEEVPYVYLYASGDDFVFMDQQSYEQVTVPASVVGEARRFLLEDLEVTALCCDGRPLRIVLPNFIEARIAETEPGIRGDSSRAGTKPARLENGTTVAVPLFVNGGDGIKIDTRTGEYVERVQK